MEARFFASPEEWRAWLEEHHDREPEVLVGYWKRGTGRPSLTWAESVDEALCFGWIDGVRRRVDDERYCIRFTPRRPRSRWSEVNVARVAELERGGRMRPAGRAAFAARTEEGTYSYERQQREAALDPERERRLRADEAAWAYFSAQPPSYRRAVIHWVTSARREETRDRRLAQLVECSAQGRRVPPLRPPG
jgi:uncharacterized protein YdeI (YjbR/CyaY-like superfamily)